MTSDGSFNGMLTLWNSVYLVLSLLRENLFELNHSKTLLSSELTVSNSSFMFRCEKKRFISSANIIGSFTCVMNRSGPKIDPWVHQK